MPPSAIRRLRPKQKGRIADVYDAVATVMGAER